MGQYDFTYEFPSDFESRAKQLLQQDPLGRQIVNVLPKCKYEYEDVGFAYHAGLKDRDYWNKHAIEFTLEGSEDDISILKRHDRSLREAFSKALRTNTSGFVVKKILYLIDDTPSLPATNEERLNTDIAAANSVLSDLVKIGERLCSNATYRKESTENSINDFFRDSLSLMGYSEVKDQTRHGLSTSGRDAGEVDILITKNGNEIAIFEGLKLNSINTAYINEHIHKAIINYNALGAATFIVAYVTVSDFESFWIKYTDYLKNYMFPIQVKRQLNTRAFPNAATRVAEMILSRDGYDFPVYFIAMNIG